MLSMNHARTGTGPLDYITARTSMPGAAGSGALRAGDCRVRALACAARTGRMDLLVSEWLAWSQGDLVQALNWNAVVLKSDPKSFACMTGGRLSAHVGMPGEARKVLREQRRKRKAERRSTLDWPESHSTKVESMRCAPR